MIALGDFVIDADDGAQTMFCFIDRGPTGNASWSGTEFYHGPGRGPGNSIDALLNAFIISGERRFLLKVEGLVAMDLGNVEERWFYMFMLKSMTRYLEVKAQIDEIGAEYAYAQHALVHYVDWMVTNEYPYLEKPEVLEFPTETWAAQEMRKCDVFNAASLHVDDQRRELYRERATFFYDYSVRTLPQMPTHTWTRPMALLMSYGWSMPWFIANPLAALPTTDSALVAGYLPRRQFVTQKNRVKRLLKQFAAGVAIAVGLLGLLAWTTPTP